MPKMRKVGAHCPTNKERWSSPSSFIVRDTKIDPRAAQRKMSEGSLAVCCSRCAGDWTFRMLDGFSHGDVNSNAKLMGGCLCVAVHRISTPRLAPWMHGTALAY